VHCQGDAAIDDALDAIESAYGTNAATGLNRIEHAANGAAGSARADENDWGVEPTFLMALLQLYGAAYRDEILGPDRTNFMIPAGACIKTSIA
jgi:predicted amidohydrolase YtcJ